MKLSKAEQREGRQEPASPLIAHGDPAISRALRFIHSRYAEDFDVGVLAREAGVSRTILGERFARLLGQPPMRYCLHWRLQKAADMLLEGSSAGQAAFAVGFHSEAAFNRAFKRHYGRPPINWRRTAKADAPDLPQQQVQYCEAKDGTRLAWSAVGSGMPLVKTANWLNHIEFDWESPVWRPWLRELTRDNCLIRYDERGNGLSDWDTPELSFDALVDDLETVVDAAGVDQFDLLGISQGAAVAIAYSIRHPGKIRRMVILGGYALGWGKRLRGEELARREAMVTLSRTGWGSDNPAYRQMFSGLYIPGGTPEQLGWWSELQRISTSPENAERLQRVFSTVDVRPLLSRVTVPTLVAHALNDNVISIEAGRRLADGIAGSAFLELDSQNHILLPSEPAWEVFWSATRNFFRTC